MKLIKPRHTNVVLLDPGVRPILNGICDFLNFSKKDFEGGMQLSES